MVSFRIVADSTADFPPDLPVRVVPVHVYLGVMDVLDKVELDLERLKDALSKSVRFRTSAPSVKEWMRAFESLGADKPILAVTLSSKLSSSFKSAQIAARMLERKGYEILVFDSWNSSIGTGIMVREAVRMAEKDVDVRSALDRLNAFREAVELYLVVADMESSARSGRIPILVGKVGKFLRIHPIFTTDSGEVKLWKTVRGLGNVVKELLAVSKGVSEVWVASAGRTSAVEDIITRLKDRGTSVVYVDADPAIAGHFGIGAFGISFVRAPQ